MTVVEQSVEIDAPVADAYSRFTRFEDFPGFSGDLTAVRQLDETRVRWEAAASGAAWETKIVEQLPNERIVWVSTDGPRSAGTVTFEALGPDRTRVALSADLGGEHALDLPPVAVRAVEERVRLSLQAFKDLVERSGGVDPWGGAITGGTVSPDVETSRDILAADGEGAEGASSRAVPRGHEASEGAPRARGRSETGGEPPVRG